MFEQRLKEILKNAGFIKLSLYKFLFNFTSRKFSGLVISSVMLMANVLESQHFLLVVLAYMGINVAERFVEKLDFKKKA